MNCQGRKLKGSGYTKTTVADSKLNDTMQQLLAAREEQDARYFPTVVAPVVPDSVSTTITFNPRTLTCIEHPR